MQATKRQTILNINFPMFSLKKSITSTYTFRTTYFQQCCKQSVLIIFPFCRNSSTVQNSKLNTVEDHPGLGNNSKSLSESSHKKSEAVFPVSESKNVCFTHYGDCRWNGKSLERQKTEMITRRRIPPNFLEEIFIPHLERWIWDARKTPPWYLMELVVAYSQMPVINRSLSTILADVVILRLTDFVGADFVKMLFPLYRMRPTDLTLFAHLSVELEEHFYELTTLNLIAIVRVYARLPKNEQQKRFMEAQVIPRLQSDIARYDTEELNALLVSLASMENMDTISNIPLLAAIVPQVERRYDETPILTSIINLNALCRLRIFHKRLISLLVNDLADSHKTRNIPPPYVAMALWTFARYGLIHRLEKQFEPMILENLHKFGTREFARLCQALPQSSCIPLKLALILNNNLPSFSKLQFSFFFLGCIRRAFFPTQTGELPQHDVEMELSASSVQPPDFYELNTSEPQESKLDDSAFLSSPTFNNSTPINVEKTFSNENDGSNAKSKIPRETFLHECLQYITTFETDFEADDILRLTRVLRHSYKQQYAYISTLFPPSWETIVNEVMILGK